MKRLHFIVQYSHITANVMTCPILVLLSLTQSMLTALREAVRATVTARWQDLAATRTILLF